MKDNKIKGFKSGKFYSLSGETKKNMRKTQEQTVTKDMLESERYISESMKTLSGYPLYGSQSNITRGEAIAISIILKANLDNKTPFKITIEKIK
jgi:hypothetical protein